MLGLRTERAHSSRHLHNCARHPEDDARNDANARNGRGFKPSKPHGPGATLAPEEARSDSGRMRADPRDATVDVRWPATITVPVAALSAVGRRRRADNPSRSFILVEHGGDRLPLVGEQGRGRRPAQSACYAALQPRISDHPLRIPRAARERCSSFAATTGPAEVPQAISLVLFPRLVRETTGRWDTIRCSSVTVVWRHRIAPRDPRSRQFGYLWNVRDTSVTLVWRQGRPGEGVAEAVTRQAVASRRSRPCRCRRRARGACAAGSAGRASQSSGARRTRGRARSARPRAARRGRGSAPSR